ncbi:DUF1819 family protein [Pirellulales bacterium]|nr:DUF1819 family protein [Pirellulales bacterium]
MTHDNGDLSSYLAIKGPFIESTYRAFRDWELDKSPRNNLRDIKETNSIGASSTSWLEQFTQVISRRYDIQDHDHQLVELVKQGWHIDDWRPIQLWHISRRDTLLRCFLIEWLFDRREEGIVTISAEAVCEYLRKLTKARLNSSDAWSDKTYRRVANGLLKTAVEFHLMRGRTFKEFESYRLPEASFVYLLHVLLEREQNTRNVVHAKDWRLFLMKHNDVEDELLRLHQFGKLRFERAGSFLELTLPCDTTADYIRSVVG